MAMTAEEAIKWKAKMCIRENCGAGCEIKKIKGKFMCHEFLATNPEEAVKAIDTYKNKHSKTMMQDFFEKHPNAPKTKLGNPIVCTYYCGYVKRAPRLCEATLEECFACWDQPLEDI